MATYSSEEIKKAAAKIANCLALSKSSNPHEAEAAKRQAEALKRKFGVSDVEIDAAHVREAFSQKLNKTTRPPVYLTSLARVIGKAFDCEFIYSFGFNQYMKFIGVGNKPELASYVYDVLRRKITKDRADYAKTLTRYSNRKNKTKALNVFCHSWIDKVYRQVKDFAGAPKEQAAIEVYTQQHYSNLKTDSRKESVSGLSEDAIFRAAINGSKAAENVNLFRPVDGSNRKESKPLPSAPKALPILQTQLF